MRDRDPKMERRMSLWLSMNLLVDRRVGLGKRVVRAVGIILVVLWPSTLQENVSYRTHAIGFGLGAVSAFVYFRRNRESIRAAEVVEVEDTEEIAP